MWVLLVMVTWDIVTVNVPDINAIYILYLNRENYIYNSKNGNYTVYTYFIKSKHFRKQKKNKPIHLTDPPDGH